MADTLAHDNIRINAVSPGVIDTPMIQPARQMLPENWFERRPLLGRLGQPAEIGRLVRFLLSTKPATSPPPNLSPTAATSRHPGAKRLFQKSLW